MIEYQHSLYHLFVIRQKVAVYTGLHYLLSLSYYLVSSLLFLSSNPFPDLTFPPY